MGYRVSYGQEWIWPSTNWWTDRTSEMSISTAANFFYIAYGARYLQNFVMVFVEPRRKDFFEMQVHHSVTCVLIYVSYISSFVRVGLVIMVLLDMADPVLHIAKQFVYIKEMSPKHNGFLSWQNLADFFFYAFGKLFWNFLV